MAKAVYLAECALMEDSAPNMNKLAKEVQNYSGVPIEDLKSAAMNVRDYIYFEFPPYLSCLSFLLCI